MHAGVCLAIIIVITLVVLAVAHESSQSEAKHRAAAVLAVRHKRNKSNFVGAFARSPAMRNCLAYSETGSAQPYFNRCTWA